MKPGKKPGLTIEQHKELGKKLSAIHENLVHIAVLLGNNYPLRTGVYKKTSKVINSLLELRSTMEDIYFRERADKLPEPSTHTYYPGHLEPNEESPNG